MFLEWNGAGHYKMEQLRGRKEIEFYFFFLKLINMLFDQKEGVPIVTPHDLEISQKYR